MLAHIWGQEDPQCFCAILYLMPSLAHGDLTCFRSCSVDLCNVYVEYLLSYVAQRSPST